MDHQFDVCRIAKGGHIERLWCNQRTRKVFPSICRSHVELFSSNQVYRLYEMCQEIMSNGVVADIPGQPVGPIFKGFDALRTDPKACHETSVKNYQWMRRNIPEEWRPEFAHSFYFSLYLRAAAVFEGLGTETTLCYAPDLVKIMTLYWMGSLKEGVRG